MKDITKYHGYRHLPRFILTMTTGSIPNNQEVRLVKSSGRDAQIVAFCLESQKKIVAQVDSTKLVLSAYTR